jgi:hypothetical protein
MESVATLTLMLLYSVPQASPVSLMVSAVFAVTSVQPMEIVLMARVASLQLIVTRMMLSSTASAPHLVIRSIKIAPLTPTYVSSQASSTISLSVLASAT